MQRIFRYEHISGVAIILSIVLGLFAANSSFTSAFQTLHHASVHIGVGTFAIDEPLINWINEGLMVFFFVLVGLEIKREILEGHLSTTRLAVLPAFAALGGMAAPAAIYAAFNSTDAQAIRGWAIPTATDIVLALGVLSLLGSRVPVGLRIFLTALAIFDDIGAVLIIALFYGAELSTGPLFVALLALAGLVALNRFRNGRLWQFVVSGLILWAAMLEAGIEPALAGVLIAFAVPLRASGRRCSSPLRETERRLHPWVVLVILPIFAFLNAGIPINDGAVEMLYSPVSMGVVGGLFFGKQLGVFSATWAAVKLGFGQRPDGVSWGQIYGAAMLAGIGFTMSLFVTSLAFTEPSLTTTSRLGILVGSLLSAVFGLTVVYKMTPRHRGAIVSADETKDPQ